MALSTCTKCGWNSFEAVEKDGILGSNYKKIFIQCAKCGGVVGVTDYWNIGALLVKICDKLGISV